MADSAFPRFVVVDEDMLNKLKTASENENAGKSTNLCSNFCPRPIENTRDIILYFTRPHRLPIVIVI